ncbi:PIN domain-containing protein [Sinomonas sp. JGH33]|uniref:PIN domain-containing protein n=1 Tax=Sinomonas terricola TaxID=3110330 RepID=A0ABU5TC73_9MICC|nr:PIN domain-containing protein [Sinomonas sp. JGH33]MEA5457290.1 PIN domain-containing protein [Sinomonas sp. JGH33]
MLHLLIDTSTCLDLAQRRDGQRWIVALRVLIHQGEVKLLVPPVIVEEFDRNEARVQAMMTSSIASRFKQIRQDLVTYGSDDDAHAVEVIEDLGRHLPLIGAMTSRNFREIRELLIAGQTVEPTEAEMMRVVERGLRKAAPFHSGKNSVADAVIFELYQTATQAADLTEDPHAFVTSNYTDFSRVNGDRREPHDNIAEAFDGTGSRYALGVDGLDMILRDHFGEEIEELFEETDFREEPRRLDEIVAAETEMFDRIWYYRSMQHDYRAEQEEDIEELERLRAIAGPARARVEATYTQPGQLGPYTDFELGMLNGKMSALRWVLGSAWDFLDT